MATDGSYRPGDRDDFDRLYRETYTRVRYMLQAIVRDPVAAEDCAQEAFVKAFQAWGTWKGDAPAEAWLHRIALNVATSYHRRERLREVGETIRRIGRPADHSPRETSVEMLDALRRLPPGCSRVSVSWSSSSGWRRSLPRGSPRLATRPCRARGTRRSKTILGGTQ